jgi:hypothetical protein
VQDTKIRGIGIGLIVAVVTWISAMTAAPGLVSTFPDGISLFVLVVLVTMSFRRTQAVPRSEVMRTGVILGACAGAVIGVSTGIRGIVRWSRPDEAMVAVTVVGSFIAVVLITIVVALIAYEAGRRGQRIRA